MMQSNKQTTIFWAIFALFVTTYILHAVIFPLNGATVDDWIYFYLGHIGETTFYRTDRQFVMLYTNFLEWVIPANAPSRTFVQTMFIGYTASLLYLSVQRFVPHKPELAYLVAFFYIVYYPTNPDLARPLFSAGIYIWMQVLIITNVFCFYEAIFATTTTRAIIWMLLAALSGFMTIRGYEGCILIILSTPLLLLLLPHKWNKKTVALTSIWFFLIGIAVWRFITYTLPTMPDSYSSAYLPTEPVSLAAVIERTILFYQLAFPLERIFIPQTNYTLPALLGSITALSAFWLFKRKNTLDATPTWRGISVTVFVGLVGFYFMSAGAGAWVYSGFTAQHYVQRMFFYSHLGQTLILGAMAAIVCYLLARILAVRLLFPLSAMIAFFGFMGAHWYYDAQLYASRISAETRYFQESLEMFRDVTGLIPYVADDTIVILFCERNPDEGHLLWSPGTLYAGGMLYDDLRLAHQEEVVFEANRVVNYNRHRDDERVFGYDQIIGLECVENRWRILPYLPQELVETNSGAAQYNPYLRIEGGLLPDERTSMLSWGTVRTEGYK